jgi:hypothetical protein
MDPRLQGENLEKIAAAAGLSSGEYEVLTYPGPSLWMTDPHLPSDADSFWWILENISINVHHVGEIVIVGHGSCGGFALKGAPKDPAAEQSVITATFSPAAQAIEKRFPQLSVVCLFVKIGKSTGSGALPEIEVERVDVLAAA